VPDGTDELYRNVLNCKSALRNMPEEGRSRLYGSRTAEPRTVVPPVNKYFQLSAKPNVFVKTRLLRINPMQVSFPSQFGVEAALYLLKAKRNLLYIRNQSVPRCKHFPSRL
jgi:hypothetical protein